MTGVMLALLGLLLPGLTMFFFAFAAMFTAAVVWLYPFALVWQLLFFTVLSLTFLCLQWILLQNWSSNVEIRGDDGADHEFSANPGDRGVVCVAISPPAQGWIKYEGRVWRAGADEEIEEGEIITVISRDGAVIHVEKV